MDSPHAGDSTLGSEESESVTANPERGAFISPAVDFLLVFALTITGAAALVVLL